MGLILWNEYILQAKEWDTNSPYYDQYVLTEDTHCCCSTSGTNCAACSDTLWVTFDTTGGPAACGLHCTIPITRSGCTWTGTDTVNNCGSCTSVTVTLEMNETTGKWKLTLTQTDCGPYEGVFTTGWKSLVNGCPTLGNFTLDYVSGSCISLNHHGSLSGPSVKAPTVSTACSGKEIALEGETLYTERQATCLTCEVWTGTGCGHCKQCERKDRTESQWRTGHCPRRKFER